MLKLPQVTVSLSLNVIGNLASEVEAQIARGKQGPINDVFTKWAARYRSFAQERFDVFSKGGGDWPDLAPSTKAARKKNKKSFSILRDTNTLFAALNATFGGAPGAIEIREMYKVVVGYGGPASHPSGGIVAEIAGFHQAGGPTLPQRKIIVPPNDDLKKNMKADMVEAIKLCKTTLSR